MTDFNAPIDPKCRNCGHPESFHYWSAGCVWVEGHRDAILPVCACRRFEPVHDLPSPTIEELEAFADKQRGGIKIYSIFRRNAGWAIQWYEPERQQKELPGTGEESFHYGLVVYQYYPTFDEMVAEEFKRLKKESK